METLIQHVNGIDLSGWQDHVNMTLVHNAGFSFAYVKCTQGVGFYEPTHAKRVQDCLLNGMLVGSYHFMDWTTDPIQQAKFFLSKANILPGELPPVVDCEVPCSLGADEVIAFIDAWTSYVEKHIGARPVIYTNRYFWEQKMAESDAFLGHPLWLAAYQGQVLVPLPLGQWKPTFWQYTSNGSVPGVDGNVDMDLFLGTLLELHALRLKGSFMKINLKSPILQNPLVHGVLAGLVTGAITLLSDPPSGGFSAWLASHGAVPLYFAASSALVSWLRNLKY